VLFPDLDEDTIFVHRSDSAEILGCFSDHPFKLDGKEWPSVEHYFQANKFVESNPGYSEKIRQASGAKQARRLGTRRFKRIRSDWAKVKRVMMTRALYTKCKTYSNVAQALLETKDAKIMEGSQYDYYWGCGRDRRAENTYGKVLMDVRKKLLEELNEEQSE
jgi:ribA/ribD-fused uncharacterized protein